MLLLGQDREQLKVVGRVGAIGIEMGLSVVVGYYGGRWLDEAFGTAPVLMWIGLAFGLAAGFKSLYLLTRRTQRELEQDVRQDPEQDPR
jgi:F0F1-type ATP synthase assembly protein I